MEYDNGMKERTVVVCHVWHHYDRDIEVFTVRSVGCAVPLKFTWTRLVRFVLGGVKRRGAADAIVQNVKRVIAHLTTVQHRSGCKHNEPVSVVTIELKKFAPEVTARSPHD